jgi:hypothetical protein
MTNLAYVVNQNGKALMPCRPSKARKLLRDQKAKTINYTPFTIQLLWDCEEHVQAVTLGIDKGSKITGVCAVSEDKVLFQAEIRHRLDVNKKIVSRRDHRRSRRNRKWYRKPRFLNRKSYRPLPSIKTNADEILRVVNAIPLPISKIIVEDVMVDIAKLNDPDLSGKQYQESNKLDSNLRLACLMRDNFKCHKCGSDKHLNAHHIVPRVKNGKDTITNLITLCRHCHEALHEFKWKLNLKGASGFRDRIAQRTMQGKSYLYEKLGNPELVFGYETAERRLELGLSKTHMIDAFCIAGGKRHSPNNSYLVSFRPRQTRKQYFDLPRKGKGRVRYQVNQELGGFRKGDIVEVKGFVKQVKAIRSSGNLKFEEIKGEPNSSVPRKCKLLLKCKTISFNKIL